MAQAPDPFSGSGPPATPSDDAFRLLVESVADYAIFMLDTQGRVLTWNAGAQRFKGYLAHEIIGRHFSTFYPPEALRRGLPAHELEVAQAVGRFEDEGFRVRKDGTLFWANVVITAMRNAQGVLVGFSKVTRDLSQRREHEESLRQSEERFRLLVEGVQDYAIFMLDVNGRIASWNTGAQRIKGYTADEIIGQHFSKFYPQDAIDSGWPEHELREATANGRFSEEGWRVRKNGTRLWVSVVITALRDQAGTLRGFSKVTRDLTERQRSEAMAVASQERDEILEAERNARMNAQRATRIKDEFLATLSHELRTPLTSILGWTQILTRSLDSLKPGDLQRGVDVIDRNARAQVQLIDDLLDLNRIMTGKIRLELAQVSMHTVVQGAIESAEPAAQAKGIALKSIVEPLGVDVSADPARMQQVVWNLVTNAIKFTPKGGQVQVLLQRVNSHIELSVSDNGIGIPAHFLPQVFDRFSQNDSSASRAFGGLGLGLAICKQLVELHGGTIRAASGGEGQGATFFVNLPVSLLQIASEAQRAHPSLPSQGEAIAMPDLEGLRVLVVDDESDTRELLQRILQAQSAVVSAASSGEDALERLKAFKPDVIVSDIGMPGMDGYQLMRVIRAAEPSGARVPAMALTAFARAEDRKRSLQAGYQAHMAKPFDVAEFILTVASLAGQG